MDSKYSSAINEILSIIRTMPLATEHDSEDFLSNITRRFDYVTIDKILMPLSHLRNGINFGVHDMRELLSPTNQINENAKCELGVTVLKGKLKEALDKYSKSPSDFPTIENYPCIRLYVTTPSFQEDVAVFMEKCMNAFAELRTQFSAERAELGAILSEKDELTPEEHDEYFPSEQDNLAKIEAIRAEISSVSNSMTETVREAKAEIDKILADIKVAEENAKKAAKDATETSDSATKTAEDAKTTVASAAETVDEAKTASDSAKESVETAKSTLANANTNVISVLGIFIAIIVVFVGGYLTFLITDINDIQKTVMELKLSIMGHNSFAIQPRYASIILLGHILINLFFLLMLLTAKLAGKSIALKCNGHKEPMNSNKPNELGSSKNNNTSNENNTCCENNCRATKKAWNKYPYLFFFNFLFFAGYAFLLCWWVFDRYIFEAADNFMFSMGLWGRIVVIVIIATIIVGVCKWAYQKLTNGEK